MLVIIPAIGVMFCIAVGVLSLSLWTMLLNSAIFPGDEKQKSEKYTALAETCEILLRAPKGTFDFLIEIAV